MELKIYSNRWGKIDRYQITKTNKGWHIRHIAINGECDKSGAPYLFDNLEQDDINYPADLGGYMEFLWDYSKDKDDVWIQKRLNELSKWIIKVEHSTPKSKFWDMY